jgi:hypothetical protein
MARRMPAVAAGRNRSIPAIGRYGASHPIAAPPSRVHDPISILISFSRRPVNGQMCISRAAGGQIS